ncbi:DUF4192 domain-containing protein [Nocardioides sp.]|uniref:DUF4192 domain-containing protein n=1 Tax=Nocardioides sp. TaxID=35761 RepID=UPI0031FE6A54|nr:hypothetical protein [Nocardioides sp.]
MTSSASTAPVTLTARSPEDLLAVVPVVLGFVPTDSVVMLTFGADDTFHARLDLPDDADGLAQLVAALLEPARLHRVRRVVFVVYSGDARLARRVRRVLVGAFESSGIQVIEVLRADGARWFPLAGGHRGVPEWGVPYDVSAHPFVVQSVLDGKVTLGSRDELAAMIATDPGGVGAVADALDGHEARADDADWVRSVVAQHVTDGTAPDVAATARLLAAIADHAVRDVAWTLMTRQTAGQHVRLWTDVVRRAPMALVPAPAALLGFAAWLSGHGALAWCAIDRCDEADPGYSMASLLGQVLTQALPPSAWDREGPATR